MRRRTAAADAAELPVVDYGFGTGGAPRPSPRRANTPARVPRSRPPLAVVATPAPPALPAPMVPIPSGLDCAEPVGTPLLRLPPSADVPSATTADVDALGAAAESHFGDSTARYSHAVWASEQQAEPACHAAMRYIALGRLPPLRDDFLSCFPSHQRPSFSEIQNLAGKGRLHTTDDGIVLPFRQPTPHPPPASQHPVGRAACLLNDECIRTYVSLLMRPRAMQACLSTASCHLGTTRTVRMLEHFYWRIGMSICTRWWPRHCLKCQARKTSRLTIR